MSDLEKVRKGLSVHESGCGHRSQLCDEMECPYRSVDDNNDCDIVGLFRDANDEIKQFAIER